MRVLLLGSGHLGASILEGLIALQQSSAIELVGVFPWSKSKKGRSLKDEGEVKLLRLIKRHGLKMIQCPGANHFEFSQHLQTLQPDVVMVGCWGEILKSHLVHRADIKLVNCHPSLLPAHRGANPYASTIALGESETGVTFHWMGEGIDDGPIILQETVPIAPEDTGGSLREKCCTAVQNLVPTLIDKLKYSHKDNYPPQPTEGVSYYPQLTLGDGLIQWEIDPKVISNRLRAFKPWLSSYSMLQGQLLFIFHQLTPETREDLHARYPKLPVLIPQAASDTDISLPIPPGTIVARQGDMIWIQSSEPDLLFKSQDYQFYLGWGFVPRSICRLVGRRILLPGRRFIQAFVQGVVTQAQTEPGTPHQL